MRFVQKEKLCRGRIVLQRRQFIYWQTEKKAVKWEREKWREVGRAPPLGTSTYNIQTFEGSPFDHIVIH